MKDSNRFATLLSEIKKRLDTCDVQEARLLTHAVRKLIISNDLTAKYIKKQIIRELGVILDLLGEDDEI